MYNPLSEILHNAYILGEYGIVYKGFLTRNLGGIVTELVAIKTLKGKISIVVEFFVGYYFRCRLRK